MFHQVCHLEVPPIGSPSSPGPAELEQAMVTNPFLALCTCVTQAVQCDTGCVRSTLHYGAPLL